MIKKKLPSMLIIIASILLCVMGALTIALFYEYRFFCVQSQKMIEMQEQYQLCTSTVRKILNQNNQFQGLSHGDAGSIDGSVAIFSDMSVVVSSDNMIKSDQFVRVNRDASHLQSAMIAFLKEENLTALLHRIDLREWHDYDGQKAAQGSSLHTIPLVRNYPVYTRVRKRKQVHAPKIKKQATDFIWPIDSNNFWLSSFFGKRKKQNGSWGMHNGVDMAAIKGTPVKAVASGVVIEARYASGYGNMVVLAHSKKYKTRSAHLNTIDVKVGQKINKGGKIGTVGDTGFIRKRGRDGSHLHFEVYEFGKRINPLRALPALT